MTRTSIIQTNFTSGELSPRVALGRMDVAKYANGVKALENCIVTIQGGAFRRPGTRYVGEVKNSDVARLVSFVYSRSQAYVLVMGQGYMWFYRNRARLGSYEVATPYTVTQLPDIGYVQKSDTAFFAHPDVYPQRLQRFADQSWVLANTVFSPEPFAEVGTMPAVALTLSNNVPGTTTVTIPSGLFLAGDVGRQIVAGAGLATIIAFNSATSLTVSIVNPFAGMLIPASTWTITGSPQATLMPSNDGPVDDTETMTLDIDGWRSEDIGKYVSLNSGLVRITGVSSAKVANGRIVTEVVTDAAAQPNSWVLMGKSWGSTRGYPRAVTINKQRLYFANTYAYPQTVWGSMIRGYLSFQISTNDDDAFAFELDGASNSPIMHLAPSRKMLVLTEADEMSLSGGQQDKSITPTNIDKNDESSAGTGNVRPIKVGNELIFASASGLKVHAIGYRYDIDGFPAPDRTIFAEHITESGIKEFSFEKLDSTLYAVRNDGVMAVCSYDIDQEVVGWGRWLTNGRFESIATIPTATAEDTYVIVARTVNGQLKRYIEVFDRDVMLDCAVVASAPEGQKVWTGLNHLEGMTVQVRADGAYRGEYQVKGGAITLSRPAKDVQVGLGFTSRIEMVQPELGANGTSSQGNPVNVCMVIVRVLDTQALVVNGTPQEFRRFDTDVLDLPPPTISGDIRVSTLEDEVYTTSQVIEQPYPAPFHVLDIIRKLTVND